MSFDVIKGYTNDLVAAAEKFEETLRAAQDSEDTSYIRLVFFNAYKCSFGLVLDIGNFCKIFKN